MRERALHDEPAPRLQKFDYLLIGVLHILTLEVSNFFRVMSSVVDGTRREVVSTNDTVGHRNPMVIFTEGRCLVHNTGSVSCCYVFIGDNSECPVLILER